MHRSTSVNEIRPIGRASQRNAWKQTLCTHENTDATTATCSDN